MARLIYVPAAYQYFDYKRQLVTHVMEFEVNLFTVESVMRGYCTITR